MSLKLQSKGSTAIFIVLAIVGTAIVAALVPWYLNRDTLPSHEASSDGKRWQAVAVGRIEPRSGEVRIVPPVAGVIGEILVKVGDRVFAGEPLVRLLDDEVRARVDAAEMQVAMRVRARNDQSVSGRAAERRRAEDAVAAAERAVIEARGKRDKGAIDRRAGKIDDAALDAVRRAYSAAEEELRKARAALERIEVDAPLPTSVEGQLNIARSDLLAVQAALEKLTVRAPIDGSILQINGRVGEFASPSSTQPLVLLGDVSALRVRAEVDERDVGQIRIGQAVVVRSSAWAGRDVAGKVAFIAPLVEAARAGFRGPRSPSDVDVVEVLIDLTEPGPLLTGAKVDVYFQR